MFNTIGKMQRSLEEIFGNPIYSYCRLETVEEGNLVADDGSYISLIKVEGTLTHNGVEEYLNIVSQLSEKLQSTLSQKGHCIQVLFEYNPDSSEYIDKLFAPSKFTAKNLGLDVEDLLSSWSEKLKEFCSTESLYFILWTRPEILPDSIRKSALNERNKRSATVPNFEFFQKINRGVEAILEIHNGFVAGILDALKAVDLIHEIINAQEALRIIRYFIDPHITSKEWRAIIPGEKLSARPAEPDSSKLRVLENTYYPDLKSQLFPRSGELLTSTTMQVGDRIYSPLMMTFMPQTPKPFQELYRVIARKNEKIPYRISFLMEHGNASGSLKTILATILSFTSAENKKFTNAIDDLKELQLDGVCCVNYQICLSTWVDLLKMPIDEAKKELKRRSNELAKAVQGWGTSDVSELIGDPLYGISATVPALMPTSPSPITIAPLEEAISMFPFRSASPWQEGSLIFRTQDGKIIPFLPNSSEQSAWIDLGVAPMGGGKSVFLNAFNFAFIFQPGLSRLPWISIIDVGPSSSGLITLIKESLPKEKQYLAAYHRLRMTADYSINPFDLPLGNRQPLPSHIAFLINLLSLLATPLTEDAPADGVPGLLRRAVDLAYEECMGTNSKLYQRNIVPDLDSLLAELDMPIDSHTTWWEVVDFLFKLGHTHEATIAQRYAVPLLSDVTSQINKNVGIQQTYPKELCSTVWRSLMDAIHAYVVLKEPTQFDLGDAQIVSLDLDEVAPRGGATADRQAAIMYMLARHILGARFFLMPDDVKLMPELYQEYHATRIEAIREDPKRLCYDEAHRVTKNQSVAGQLQNDLSTMSRESRKWNLSIGLYTQSIEDIPDIIIELATTITVLGSGTTENVNMLQRRFGLNGACTYALPRLGKPGAKGSNFLGLFRTGNGLSQLVLTLSISSHALWAFSTTTEDVSIRNKLYKQMSATKALKILAEKFPGGSAKREVERRKALVEDSSQIGDDQVDIINNIVKELVG